MTASRVAPWVLLLAIHATKIGANRNSNSDTVASLQGNGASTSASPGEITQNWCDKGKLRDMHGEDSDNLEESEMEELEDKVLSAVKHELEHNNVDKMAKDIFSFYVCVRWAPDKVFWDLAKKELPSMVEDSIRDLMPHTDTADDDDNDDDDKTEPMDDEAKLVAGDRKKAELEEAARQGEALAIAEMYRTYRFVPMLCSQSLTVFGQKNEEGLHFPLFEQQVESLADFIAMNRTSTTYSNLTALDRIFCKSGIMTACSRFDFMNNIMDLFGAKWNGDQKHGLAERLQEFGDSTSEDFKAWKARFPYHSFITKAPDYKADKHFAPTAEQRFVVCFGKRVASDLHRRKNGQHILTDQNNIGCHGWYDHGETVDQLQRMVKMWKPPTCQLATMSYTMKKELMQKFSAMNEMLFEALPSMINDELQDQERQGAFDSEDEGEGVRLKPWVHIQAVTVDNVTFVEGMRVRSMKTHKPCFVCPKENPGCKCETAKVSAGTYGSVKIQRGRRLGVKWDGLAVASVASAEFLQVMPKEWRGKTSPIGHVRDFVSGVSHVAGSAYDMFAGIFPRKQRGIADLMSGSVSKWAVCPIKEDVEDHAELNRQLGQEDPAFQDFQHLGYRKWRPHEGIEPETPGAKCEGITDEYNQGQFPEGTVCKISELQENYVEAYKEPQKNSADYEEFICPIRPPLPAGNQLKVLQEKDTCFLHMTGMQQEQHSWRYQGFFPARLQNEKKPNDPRVEFELVKLTDVGGPEIKAEASFARYCTVEELTSENGPRFCDLPKVHNDPSTMDNVVNMLSDALHGVMDGDTAASMDNVGMTVVENTLRAQERAATRSARSEGHQEQSGEEQSGWKNKTKDAGIWASQATWQQIRGAGRFIVSSTMYAATMQQFIGEGRMAQQLHDSIFVKAQAGPLLHALSFQTSSGTKGVNENEKEAFERYVMAYPCPDFEPGTFFATKSKWRKVVARSVVEAYNTFVHWKSDATKQSVLDFQTLNLYMRGEGFMYKNTMSHKAAVFKESQASIMWEEASEAIGGSSERFQCKWDGQACVPEKWCTKTWGSWLSRNPSGDRCQERSSSRQQRFMESGGWVKIGDRQLAHNFAPMLTTGGFDFEDLKGVKMTLWCGKKKEFGPTGAPAKTQTTSLLDCMAKGMADNQALQAKEPWKLYFPEETVVVAQFTQIEAGLGRCLVSKKASGDAEYRNEVDQVCKGVQKVAPEAEDFQHIVDEKKFVPWGKDPRSDDVFVGARLGFGFPAATLSEVVLKPQDILEAIGAIPASHAV